MMRSNRLYLRQQAVLDVEPAVAMLLLEDVVSDADVEFDAEKIHGSKSEGNISYTYDWKVESDPNGSLIREDTYVDPITHYVTTANNIGGGLMILILAGWLPAGVALLFGLIWLVGGTYVGARTEAGLIQDLIETSDSFTRVPIGSALYLLLVILLLCGAVGFITGIAWIVVWAGCLAVALGVVSGFGNHWYALVMQRIDHQRFLPNPTTNYFSIISLQFVFPFLALFSYLFLLEFEKTLWGKYGTPEQLELLAQASPSLRLAMVQIVLVYIAIRSLLVLSTIRDSVGELTISYRLFRQDTEKVKPIWVQVVSVGVACLPGLIGAVLVWEYLHLYGGQFQNSLSQVLMLIVLLPASLHFIGILNQTIIPTVTIGKQLRQSTLPSIRVADSIQARVRVVDRSDAYAASISLGFADYIFVSEGLIHELSGEELHAILAHEQGHIQYGDAIVGSLIPYLATLVFTGRNALYGALDFRSREFRADRFAVEETSPETYMSALQKARRLGQQHSLLGTGPGLSSAVAFTAGKMTWISRYLSLFYGTYAMSEAHPSFQERIQKIVKSSERPELLS